jgi:hypothetical protein
MSEIASLLRLLVQSDKEFKVTAITTVGSATKFTSALSAGYKRKRLEAYYNNSANLSGEILWGGSDVVTNGMPMQKGVAVTLPVSSSLDVYFANSTSGELGLLKIVEFA